MAKKKKQADLSMRRDEDSSDSVEETQKKASAINCPHANKAIHLPGVKKALKPDSFPLTCNGCAKGKSNNNVSSCENEDWSLLMCLKCGHCGCGSGSKHAEQHSNNRKSDVHDLALNLTTWTVWCFKCSVEIPPKSSKKLLECYEFIKKITASSSLEMKVISVENLEDTEVKSSISYLSTKSGKNSNFVLLPPGFESYVSQNSSYLDSLPRARGLYNLGNTCFFNAVLQCLGQTPFLLTILEEMKEGGEKFRLPGGEVLVGEEKENLEPLEGVLKGWGQVTQTLADTLSEIQSGKSEVFQPRKLLYQLHVKCPQFAGYGQHDSHELLRQLLEIVRTEDLQRYKQAILETLNLDKKSERENITEEMRRKVKAYGKQANDLLLRPEQVFRGFLVSTLECQECHHRSDHVESFLDLSLPVMADKPVHVRAKPVYDEGGDLNSAPSKHQLKMRRKAAAKSRRSRHKHQTYNAAGDATGDDDTKNSSDSDNQDQSDADVEDNVEPEVNQNQDVIESGYSSEKPFNGDSTCGSPSSETNIHLNRDSAIASPITNDNNITNNASDQVLNLSIPDNSLSKNNILISSPGSHVSMACQPSPLTSSSEANLECCLSPNDQDLDSNIKVDRSVSRFDYNAEIAELPSTHNSADSTNQNGNNHLGNDAPFMETDSTLLKSSESEKITRLEKGFGRIILNTPDKENNTSNLYNKEEEDDDGEDFAISADGTIGQRICGENSGECTIHSCLNQFTAKELMTGNNKVGCEACTKRMNHGKEGKTALTNTSKQLLVCSPPAVLILHLKRFQVLRCAFKKKCREVKFPMVLDLAPYCSTKCKGESTIKKNQNEILYSLYGVVEHMGTFHRGHYVAYVKVRSPLKPDDPRWSFLPKSAHSNFAAEAKDLNFDHSQQNGAVGGTFVPPPGKWYYVSDSCTSEVKEENVLSSKAYLLFYERIW